MSDEETIAYSMKEEEGPARETSPAGPPERGGRTAETPEKEEEKEGQGEQGSLSRGGHPPPSPPPPPAAGHSGSGVRQAAVG